jgi:hypothetical protein
VFSHGGAELRRSYSCGSRHASTNTKTRATQIPGVAMGFPLPRRRPTAFLLPHTLSFTVGGDGKQDGAADDSMCARKSTSLNKYPRTQSRNPSSFHGESLRFGDVRLPSTNIAMAIARVAARDLTWWPHLSALVHARPRKREDGPHRGKGSGPKW